jgi:hypothetical protein
MIRKTFWSAILCSAMMCGLMASCNTNDGGTEIPNELAGKELIAGKGPAVNAEVKLIRVGYAPGSLDPDSGAGAMIIGTTDAGGRFAFKDVPPGQYNILASKDGLSAFRDSVNVTGRRQTVETDTLKAPGSISGRIQLELQHDPRSATVQVLGTTLFVNVDSAGAFSLKNLGEGEYRLRVVTGQAGYAALYAEFRITAGQNTAFPEPLRPFYLGTPLVEGITVDQGPEGSGSLVIRWKKSSYSKVQAYLIYRDSAGALLPTAMPLDRTTDTVYFDTLYSKTPRPGQFPFLDTLNRVFSYRIKILDQSGEPGPSFGAIPGEAVAPTRKPSTGVWKKAPQTTSFGSRWGASLVQFKDRIWLLGGRTNHPAPSSLLGQEKGIWSSSDGLAWDSVSALPISDSCHTLKATVFHDSLWILATNGTGSIEDDLLVSPQSRLQLWATADGVDWRKAADSVPVPFRLEYTFAELAGKLWILGGRLLIENASHGEVPMKDAWSSADGVSWAKSSGTTGPASAYYSVVHNGTLTVVGTDQRGSSATPLGARSAWTFDPTAGWTRIADTVEFLPLIVPTLATHEGRLYMMCGAVHEDGVSPYHQQKDVIWSSEKGIYWNQEVHAPFGFRWGMAAVSFRGRLWVYGGIDTKAPQGDEDAAYPLDIWSMGIP